jgi:NADPH:quinone reductase-like Zn-dependent oxidoreductase
MKVVRLSAPYELEQLSVTMGPEPGEPGPGHIRVRIHASSLNYHDYAVVRGWLPTAAGRIPLSDGAGVVDAVGPGVEEFKVGDSVVSCFSPTWQDGPPKLAGFGETPGDGLDGYARELVVTPATWFTRAPDGYSHIEAATLTTAGLTAWRGLVSEGGLIAGETVLTMGSGGVSIFALQIAKAMGATVIATSSSDAKLDRLKELGADHVINYRSNPEWGVKVRDLTGGVGVDHVVEVGGPATMAQSTQAVRVGGHMSLIGVLTGFSGDIPFATLLQRQIRALGITVGSRAHQIAFIRGIDATGLKPVIDRVHALDELGAAFSHEEAGAHFGKIAITV